VKKILAGLALVIAVAGCDAVDGMRDMKDAEDQLRGMIEEDIGVEALVGFKMDKDELIDVSIGFDADAVADRSVSELMRAVRLAVAASFKTKPGAIYIQIAIITE
jgi:hypothetical protein